MRLARSILIGLVFVGIAGCASDKTGGGGAFKVGNPYQISGVWYYPKEDPFYDETGIASWYGEDFHGKATANGERYDMNALTAAHRTLPMPVVVRVTNLENGRSLRLRLNDRGPYARGRIIDVSKRAAQLLGFQENGTARPSY
jgi:rare lipoprotein A